MFTSSSEYIQPLITVGDAAPHLVWDCWKEHARRRPDHEAIVHHSVAGENRRWTYGALWNRAMEIARMLRSAGIAEHHVCATVIRHHPEFYPLYMGIELAGAIPAVLAYPNDRIHPDKFREGLRGMSRRSGLDWILTEASLEPVVGPLVQEPGSTIRGVLCPLDARLPFERDLDSFEPPRRSPNEPCLLQHSSGTTGLQKAVMLSHRAVLEHVHRYGVAIAAQSTDRVVSWLPLYHDMGLIAAFHLPLALGIPTVQLDPFEWVLAPGLMLDVLSREQGTLAWLPNFAYNVMADRVHDDELDGVSLDHVRLLVNCSEPIRDESHERFLRRFAPSGLRAEALATCYAMAETTFAAAQSVPGVVPPVVRADREQLAAGIYVPSPGGRRCVSSGRAIEGCEIRAVDASGGTLPDAQVGELAVRSPSMFSGYRNAPEITRRAMIGDWYRTGDTGFLLDGETFVIGRLKDLLIVAGKNIFPEDIEDAVGEVPGILPGRVVAFGEEDEQAGTERVCVVAETPITDAASRRALRRSVVQAGMQIDVTIAAVFLAEPRWLIKSSSGKPSRSMNRARALGELSREG